MKRSPIFLRSFYHLSALLFGCMACVSLALCYYVGPQSGISFLVGGMISLIPTLLFGYLSLKKPKAAPQEAQKVVNQLYGAEAFKWAITVISLIGVYYCQAFNAKYVLGGFIGAQMVYAKFILNYTK